MFITILKTKIHRATVTDAQIHYSGSITIDRNLMEHAKIHPFEKVLVVSLESGERLETYVIEGEQNSGEICINGAAARKILKGDRIIIMAFSIVDEREAMDFKPLIVQVDENNEIISEQEQAPESDEC